MRQFIYFLIGLGLSSLIIPLSYAVQLYPNEGYSCDVYSNVPSYMMQNLEGHVYCEYSDDSNNYTPPSDSVVHVSFLENRYNSTCQILHQVFTITEFDVPTKYFIVSKVQDAVVSNFSDTPPVVDSDSDGIPDEFDLYKNDPDPYKYYVLNQLEDPNTGEIIFTSVKTDRGDTFDFGEYPSDPHNYYSHVYLAPEARNPEDLQNEIFMGGTGTGPNSPYNDAIDDYVNNQPSVPEGQGTGFDDSQDSDPGDTDSQALGKIVSNTKDISGNIKRLGDYLQDINSTLGRIDRKGDIEFTGNNPNEGGTGSGGLDPTEDTTGGLTKDELETVLDESQGDIDSALATASQSDTAFSEAQTLITGEASLDTDAPDEFKQKTNLEEKFNEMLTNNPISDIITNTRVEISGAVSYLEFDYNGNMIKLDLGGYETQLQLFGNILFAVSTIAGMLLVFRGF